MLQDEEEASRTAFQISLSRLHVMSMQIDLTVPIVD